MTNQFNPTSVAPVSGLVVVLSDIIAPIANVAASILISIATKLSQRNDKKKIKSVGIVAPHVALVMVPGTFVTGAFINR